MPEADEGVIKRSIAIAGHRTSVSLEEPFWAELKRLADLRAMSVAQLIGEIDRGRARRTLSSAIRLHVLEQALRR